MRKEIVLSALLLHGGYAFAEEPKAESPDVPSNPEAATVPS